jgi:catechol 2,3-dioxygenase-like lactoylglutathione lyase family enzyme
MATVQVRYIVHDVDAAIAFYTQQLGFTLVMHPAPPFAMLTLGDLRLVLSAPNPSAGGGNPCLTAPLKNQGAGTASPLKSPISLSSFRS